MILSFTKMHGTGNDFIVLDGVRNFIQMSTDLAILLSHRNFGVGANQILVIEKSTRIDSDFRYRIYNQDGSEADHCGNGARCFAWFVHENGFSKKNPIYAEVKKGILCLEIIEKEKVKVDMGDISFDPKSILCDVTGLIHTVQEKDYIWTLYLNSYEFKFSAVSLYNPHVVQVVENIEQISVNILGPLIESHDLFSTRVNVCFMQVISRNFIKIRVYERGVGETLSCGTGACAAVITGIRRGILDNKVKVKTHGGELTVECIENKIYLIGQAISVFSGTIDIDKLFI